MGAILNAIANFLRRNQAIVHSLFVCMVASVILLAQNAEHQGVYLPWTIAGVYASFCMEVIIFSRTIRATFGVMAICGVLYPLGLVSLTFLGYRPTGGYAFLGIIGIWLVSIIGSNDEVWRRAKYAPGIYAPPSEGQCDACQIESYNQKRFIKCTH